VVDRASGSRRDRLPHPVTSPEKVSAATREGHHQGHDFEESARSLRLEDEAVVKRRRIAELAVRIVQPSRGAASSSATDNDQLCHLAVGWFKHLPHDRSCESNVITSGQLPYRRRSHLTGSALHELSSDDEVRLVPFRRPQPPRGNGDRPVPRAELARGFGLRNRACLSSPMDRSPVRGGGDGRHRCST